ncbi:MAG: hypothetical protein KatS3mg108_2265 [Isosphaeraceae bacterium]|jgi:hypothetical protein|nr:MAG: hypothetical protein KatS3mg108_2265 [Isosphaeraceae bacterium]
MASTQWLNSILKPADVTESWNATTKSRRTRAGQSRALDTTCGQLALTHRPTGLCVRGEIPRGHRSRRAMRSLRDKLRARFWSDLEAAVVRHLRVAGRST